MASTLDGDRDRALAVAPDVPYFSENYMLATYDPRADLGMWLHLGTWPQDFELWEDLALIALPGDEGLLWTRAYLRTPVERRPAGPNLRFECLEPFRRWRVTFDGVCVRTPYDEMLSGLARDRAHERVTFELDAECVTPIWDAHASATSGRGGGSMAEQVWASEHYQQLLRITGQVQLEDRTIDVDTTGVRDHSRGPRGAGMERWGGHTLIHVLFPSGRAVAVQRMWSPDGDVTLDTAYVLVDGQIRYCDVLELPQLETIQLSGDKLRLVLRSEAGEHRFEGEMMKTTFSTPFGGLCVGADTSGPIGVFGFGHARWTWEDEDGYGLTERSNRLPAS